ncbi:PiggyBac transposable element-derived protein 3, partial [Trichinella zimbabwensis]
IRPSTELPSSFHRCGISGILYDFAFYELCRPKVEKSVGFVPGDFLRLKEEGIWTCGTIRSNRLRGCPLMSEQALKVNGRGTTDFRTTRARDIIAVAWYDNRRVTLTSTYLGVKPLKLKPRWDRKQHKRVMVNVPSIVHNYNMHMGGVDLNNMLSGLYRVSHRSRKWTKIIFRDEIPLNTMGCKFTGDIVHHFHTDQLTCLNDLKLSDCNTRGLPLRAIKRLNACRSRGAVISDTTSRCTARVVIQNGPAMSKPVFSNGCVTRIRSAGRGAIFATNGLDSIRLQHGQAYMTPFTSRLPLKIQYRCLRVASVSSHPPWNCRKWHLHIIAV